MGLSMMWNISPLELGWITVLLSFIGDIGNPLKLHQGAWDSSPVVIWNSVPLELLQGSLAPLNCGCGTWVSSSCSGTGVPRGLKQWFGAHLELHVECRFLLSSGRRPGSCQVTAGDSELL